MDVPFFLLGYPTATELVGNLAFTPDGARLIVGDERNINIWDVGPERQALAAAHRRDAPHQVSAWHIAQAELNQRKMEWFAARFHWTWQIADEPKDGNAYFWRAQANAELGRWDEAAADVAWVVAENPDELGPRYLQFLLALRAGQQEKCRQIGAHVWQHRSPELSANDEAIVAWMCCLAPGPPADPKEVVKLAEHAVAREAHWHYLMALGAALSRAGQQDEAVKRLREAVRRHPQGGDPQSWLFLALAYHALGQGEEARHCLDVGVAQRKEKLADLMNWRDRLESDLLQAEVEKLLGEKRP